MFGSKKRINELLNQLTAAEAQVRKEEALRMEMQERLAARNIELMRERALRLNAEKQRDTLLAAREKRCNNLRNYKQKEKVS